MNMSNEIEEKLRNGILAWQEGKEEEALALLLAAQDGGSMKAGRYLGIIYLQQAARRGDITSEVILGMLSEYGCGLEENSEKAEEYYLSALRDNHPDREGVMLAAGADLGMGRILALGAGITPETSSGSSLNQLWKDACCHLKAAAEGGDERIRREAEFWMNSGIC